MFALLHQQYSFSLSTLVVLILGLVLGFIRDRTNTSTSMIVHAVFNSTQGLLALLNVIK
jgi:membrane protease YdiL (CAAX protease family)